MSFDEGHELASLTARLQRRYPEFDPGLVARTVASVAEELRDAPVRLYVPLLVEREARDLLADAADRLVTV